MPPDNMYVYKKQFWRGGRHFVVPDDSLVLMRGTTMFPFDRIFDDREERFAMKLKDRKWAIYRGIDDIVQDFNEQGKSDNLFQITNGDHQLIVTPL